MSENTHYQKLWTSLERREKQAMRSTKHFSWFLSLLSFLPPRWKKDQTDQKTDQKEHNVKNLNKIEMNIAIINNELKDFFWGFNLRYNHA